MIFIKINEKFIISNNRKYLLNKNKMLDDCFLNNIIILKFEFIKN